MFAAPGEAINGKSVREIADRWKAQIDQPFLPRDVNRFDTSLIPVLLTQDIRFRGSLGQTKNGHFEFAEYVNFIRRTDFTNEIEEFISEGDKAFARLTYRGTHRGKLFGIAATGRRIEYAGAALFSFRGAKIAEVWVLGDIYGLISQLRSAAGEDPGR